MTKTETPDERDPLLSMTDEEESRVRARPTRPSASVSDGEPKLDSERPQRLARALRFAELLLDTLPPGDATRSLLDLAIKRRDEALLEAVMKELHKKQRQGAR